MHRIAVLAMLAAGCTAPAIESYCNATLDSVECSFTNMGGTGESCVEVMLVNEQAGLSTKTSQPVCSGELAKMATSNVQGTFSDPQPSEVCKNENGDVDWDKCNLTVKQVR